MAINKCTYFGMPAYRWGKDGKPFMYNPERKGAKERAKAAAQAEGNRMKAIEKAEKAAKKK